MTILIKNIQLIDGSGSPAVKSDVLIKADKISAVEPAINYKADETIDGLNAHLAPGFIDINNHSDRHLSIFFEPNQKHFLLQGITTIIGGQGGVSLAPLLYGSLQSIRPWADVNKINVSWHDLSELFKIIQKQGIGINFGTLVGHLTVRRALVGESISENLTPREMKVFDSILKKSFKNGALGVSIGLDRLQTAQVSYFEIKKFIETAAKFRKICAINFETNLKKENLAETTKKTVFLAKETAAKILINDLLPNVGFEDDFYRALEIIKKNLSLADVYFNFYPFETRFVPIDDFLPKWAKKPKKELTIENFKNTENKRRIVLSLPKLTGKEIIVNSPSCGYLIGKSLEEFSLNRKLSVKQGLIKLMEITQMRAQLACKNVSNEALMKAVSHQRGLISSSASHLQNLAAFKKFLELIEKDKIMTIEEAIKKITFLPARFLGLEKRGLVKNGYFADLVIFKDGEIRDVILNGRQAVKEGQFQNILAGEIIG